MQHVLHLRAHLGGYDAADPDVVGGGGGGAPPGLTARLARLDAALPLRAFQPNGGLTALPWATYVAGPPLLPRLIYGEDLLAECTRGEVVEDFVCEPLPGHEVLAPVHAAAARLEDPALWAGDEALGHLRARAAG